MYRTPSPNDKGRTITEIQAPITVESKFAPESQHEDFIKRPTTTEIQLPVVTIESRLTPDSQNGGSINGLTTTGYQVPVTIESSLTPESPDEGSDERSQIVCITKGYSNSIFHSLKISLVIETTCVAIAGQRGKASYR